MRSIHLRAPRDGGIEAVVRVPGDKSISHRALILAAMANGTTRVLGANVGADVLATAGALAAFGIRIRRTGADEFVVTGADALADPVATIDCGNSGTSMRMLAGFAAGRVNAVLDGDASLRRRPMARVVEPLRELGAKIETAADGRPPIVLHRSE